MPALLAVVVVVVGLFVLCKGEDECSHLTQFTLYEKSAADDDTHLVVVGL